MPEVVSETADLLRGRRRRALVWFCKFDVRIFPEFRGHGSGVALRRQLDNMNLNLLDHTNAARSVLREDGVKFVQRKRGVRLH
jgi:hypothetical protein